MVHHATAKRFSLGRVVATPGALAALASAGETALPYFAQHLAGDWGDVDPGDKAANDRAIREGSRVVSAYRLGDGTRIWIITEADRSSTCILLPEEY